MPHLVAIKLSIKLYPIYKIDINNLQINELGEVTNN